MKTKDAKKKPERLREILKELEQKHHIAETSKSANIRISTGTVADIIDILTDRL